MIPRDRIRSALALERPDRPPVGAWNHAYDREWSPSQLAAYTVGRARDLGWDYVKFQPRATCFAEALGGEYRPSGSTREGPVLVRPAIGEVDGWSRLPAVDASVAALADQVDAIGRVARELGPSTPVIQTVFSPITVATYLAGGSEDRVLADLRAHPDAVRPALDRIADLLVDFGLRSVRAGAAGVFYAVSGYASADVMPLDEYRAVALPHDLRILSALPSDAWCNVLHLCGSRLHFEIAAEVPAQAVSWSIANPGNPTLAEGREISGKAVLGGLGHKTTLVSGSADEIAAEVRAAIEDTGGRGLLIGPGCSVSPWAPVANLARLAEAAAA
ncbi:MAG: uroporphyrinogen decarboxylase family protein [Candidatus Dormibacteraceae bacterium]